MLYVGTDGHVIAVDADTLSTQWQLALPNGSDDITDVLFSNGKLYAGVNGNIFIITSTGSVKTRNKLSLTNENVRLVMSVDGTTLYAGTDGYVVAVPSSNLQYVLDAPTNE